MEMQLPISPINSRTVALTKREQNVVDEVLKGLTNREVAHNLHICERTIKTYMNLIFRKMNVKSRTQLILKVMEQRKQLLGA